MRTLFSVIWFFAIMHSSAQNAKWNQVELDDKRIYDIPEEGEIVNTLFDVPETQDTIKSAIVLNNDPLFKILFTKGKLMGDTLKILIHQTDPAFHQEYMITVLKGKYNISYDLRTGGDEEWTRMGTLKSKVLLNCLDFEVGKTIRGYTEYIGKCLEGCIDNEEPVSLKGNFKVLIE